MKRFFCTICQRVIRVRKYPRSIDTREPEMIINPEHRIGKCNWHDVVNERQNRQTVSAGRK